MQSPNVTAEWLKHAKTSAGMKGGLVVCHVKFPICSSPPRQDSPDHGPCNAKGLMLMGTPLWIPVPIPTMVWFNCFCFSMLDHVDVFCNHDIEFSFSIKFSMCSVMISGLWSSAFYEVQFCTCYLWSGMICIIQFAKFPFHSHKILWTKTYYLTTRVGKWFSPFCLLMQRPCKYRTLVGKC